MQIDNTFNVPLAPEDAWRTLMNIELIAPCLPGAQLTEKVDDRTYKGNVGVRLGPVALTFAGTAEFTEIDDDAHVATVKANGRDAKGRGGAQATVKFRVEPANPGSLVLVNTDLALSGAVAQYGRGAGLIQEVANQLIKQFSTSLRQMINDQAVPATPAADADAAPAAPPIQATAAPPPAKQISGFSILLRAIWASIVKAFTGAGAKG